MEREGTRKRVGGARERRKEKERGEGEGKREEGKRKRERQKARQIRNKRENTARGKKPEKATEDGRHIAKNTTIFASDYSDQSRNRQP